MASQPLSVFRQSTPRALQERRCGKHKTRGNYYCSWNCFVLPAAAASASSASLAAGGSLLRNVHMERFTVFFRRTIDFSRSRCRWRWRSSMLRTFRLGRPRRSFRRHGRSCVIWRNSKDEMMQGDPAIRTLDPYSLFTTYILSPPPPYSTLLYCVQPTHVFPYCIYTYHVRTVSVLYPYSLGRLGGDPHRNLAGGASTD